ncbi:hypothetical protein ACS0TY_004899 [Phlomoides rotata]
METAITPQSRNIELHGGEETPSLLEEIIFEEILPKLPVKSLLKFRCVSKSWCSLIGSKNFIKAHLNSSIKSSNFDHHRILIDSSSLINACVELKLCSLPSFDMPFTDLIPCNADVGVFKFESLRLVGSCDGILCLLMKKKRFMLWNPTTKMSNNLPDFDNEMKSVRIKTYGFGFDESNNDYKVFGLSKSRSSDVSIGKVYSLRTNSWEVIEEMDDSPGNGAGVYAIGKLHWCRVDLDYNYDIVSFDLSSHVYGVVELPSYPPKSKIMHTLGVIGGCLSVHIIQTNLDLYIWVMKEYGMKESWDKVACAPCTKGWIPCPTPIPIAISTNGEVLLTYEKEYFHIYNPKCGVYRRTHVAGCRLFLYLGFYIESLASVAPNGEQES